VKKRTVIVSSVMLGLSLMQLYSLRQASEAMTLNSFDLQVGKSKIHVNVEGRLNISQRQLQSYIEDASRAVIKYYGRFPLSQTVINVTATPGDTVGFATATYDDDAECGVIDINIGRNVDSQSLDTSWTLTHEMLHLAFPVVHHNRRWLAEGIATYAEPIGRLRTGKLSAEEVWSDLVDNCPSGLPAQGAPGLNKNGSWGSTYWGGALFCLLADVEIRKQTNNRLGLEHALRAITDSGGSAASDWTAEQAIATGDRALGLQVLQSLYARMALRPGYVDLPTLWRELGVKRVGGSVVLVDNAPLSHIRRAIESNGASKPANGS